MSSLSAASVDSFKINWGKSFNLVVNNITPGPPYPDVMERLLKIDTPVPSLSSLTHPRGRDLLGPASASRGGGREVQKKTSQ
jgi:hypothetical protein